ncbi:GNAT family protein [Actinokineospora auranticolor]|uniref:RimJ/RimL family protein N-acetyltransferase n=1 Tax=Actinokineospora auranticolor TaxID=155976 RepID=A0A2S6H0U4_9PSEU|nr:GNAT family protein [Actinokineospora auranticolor]PPK71037.1 RimJ/RimL family protein N-acetyltransferase [Actinokineospora auranticolor]
MARPLFTPATRPPELLVGEGFELRRKTPDSAADLVRVVAEAREHLRPWMAWAQGDYDLGAAREYLAAMSRSWEAGSEFEYSLFVGGELAGGCSLMARIGPGGLEVGYWLHPAHVGAGLATRAAATLVETAFAMPDVDRVEILHDTANERSRRIPRRLGFREVAREPQTTEPLSPGEDGIDIRWRVTRSEWRARTA